VCLLLLAASVCWLSGCGVTQNPSYFPHLVPFGDIIPTHAKPPGASYFSNFDPHAVRLEVRPLDATNPVRTQHVLIATVYDETGKPRRHRRVEWMLEGEGNIIEVDESGLFPGRGYKTSNKHAVSYTDYHEHKITRGNSNPADDFTIRPGQTWCVITSAREGDTHVTVSAPGVANWDRGRVFATCRWVDANWALPPPASGRAGTEIVLTTNIFGQTDHRPLANYRVRYTILEGPDAVFLPSRTKEVVAVSDLSGNAHATITEIIPILGVNKVAIEIIRPPDPTAPSGTGIVVARGETTVEWLAPQVALTQTGPASAIVGQEVAYTTAISNSGRVESRSMTVTTPIPDGVQYVRSQPPAFSDGKQLVWTLGTLQPNQTETLQAFFKALRQGEVSCCAMVVTEEGLRDTKCAKTQVTAPGLKVSLSGPASASIGVPITYQITIQNTGTGPADSVALKADFDQGLEHETKVNILDKKLGTLAPQETKVESLVLTPRQVGKLSTRLTATAAGGLFDTAEYSVVVQQPQLALKFDGPKTRIEGRPADFVLTISNGGDVALTNVVVRDQLPPELAFVSAGQGGKLTGTEVVWTLGTLQPREQRILQLSVNSAKVSSAAVQIAVATADMGVRVEDRASLEILASPTAFKTKVIDDGDPVAVGKQVTYSIEATNTGTMPANQVEIRAVLPKELKFIRATGPSKESVDGQVITFAKVDSVAKDQTLKYTVVAEGVQPGDVRFRAEFRWQGLDPQQPIFEEESTKVYGPGGQ
jgi:uncharacterized repeat protein (TIGR01451 family)